MTRAESQPPVERPARAATLVALALFALVGIGGPLVGFGVFAATDALVAGSPYHEAGLSGGVQTLSFNDTYDTFLPNTLLFADALRGGEWASWNPYILGGVPLGATPNFAVASPLTVPFYVLPGWLAPAWVKLVEIAVTVTGVALFARRLGLGRPAALVGGLVFAAGGFLIAWTNWPQTRTAAVVGFVFWAVERLVQRGRALDAVLLALAVAAMLVGGFPAVTGYALFFAGIYLLVRVVAEYRRRRFALRVVLAAGAGVLAGAALTAVQLLPFAATLSGSLVEGRAQTPQDHLPVEALLTALAPRALGTLNPDGIPGFVPVGGFIEALSYVGAAALVLMLVAMASPVRGRALLPRGTWLFLVLATVLTGIATYAGGPLLAAVQQLPVLFADNYVGRVRSLLGFLVAVLAAAGFELALRGRSAPARPRWARWFAVGVWLAAAAGFGWLWALGRSLAQEADRADTVDRTAALDLEVLVATALALVAVAAVVALYRGAGWLRVAAAVLLPLLIAVQALDLVRGYWPRSDRETFFPVTDVQRFLADELDHERYAHSLDGMGIGADAPLRLRALNGHIFVDRRFGELVEQLPGRQFGDPPTLPVLGGSTEVATSPVLDRLGVRYFVTSPAEPVLGHLRSEVVEQPGTTVLRPGAEVAVPLDAGADVRGVGITPRALPDGSWRIEVVLRDGDGEEVARGARTDRGAVPGEVFTVPVDQVDAAGPLTAELTLQGPEPLQVTAVAGVPVLTSTRAPDEGGLRLVHAGSSTVYERTTALPRIRWASEVVVEPDPQRRVELVASGAVGPDEVVLDAPAGGDGGGAADVAVLDDGFDEIEIAVDATAAGHLVVADALQNGWTARIDGAPAPLLAADHGVVAVPVPAGRHVVTLSYGSTATTAGGWISAGTALVLLTTAAAGLRRGRDATGGGTPGYPRTVRSGPRPRSRSSDPTS